MGDGRSGVPGGAEARGPVLEIEPEAKAEAAPPILRLRLRVEGEAIDRERAALFEGELGTGHLRQIEQNKISKTLSKRMVPGVVFEEEGAVVVAPAVDLELGGTYTFASGSPLFSKAIRVVDEDVEPRLSRIWPPVGKGAGVGYGVWCGDAAMPEAEQEARLEPLGLLGRLSVGAVTGAGVGCVRFEAEQPMSWVGGEWPWLIGPPVFAWPGGRARLDPRPFVVERAWEGAPSLVCEPYEVVFGSGCAEVLDDRLMVRTPEEDLLWVISAPSIGLDQVLATSAGDLMVVSLLPPQTEIEFNLSMVNTEGGIQKSDVLVTTLEAMPHVILNEVYANPLGAEPAQEWVEVVNDGAAAARLFGYTLMDIGGEAVLPEAELLPGAYALIVNEPFEEDDELDAVPAAGTMLIRVPRLGKGGLSNSGEPLKLLDGEGKVVSRFGAGPRVKAGQSVARRFPAAADGVSASFAAAVPTPGAPNGF